MADSQVTSVNVSYHKGDKEKLTAEIKFSIPSTSELKNPDGSPGNEFNFNSSGGATDVILNFIEEPGTATKRTKKVTRTGNITLISDFDDRQETIAKLYLKKTTGTPVAKKSQSADDYNEDPSEITGEIK